MVSGCLVINGYTFKEERFAQYRQKCYPICYAISLKPTKASLHEKQVV